VRPEHLDLTAATRALRPKGWMAVGVDLNDDEVQVRIRRPGEGRERRLLFSRKWFEDRSASEVLAGLVVRATDWT